MKEINFQILSSYADNNIIFLSLKRLNNNEAKITYSIVSEFDFNDKDILIYGISNLDDSSLDIIINTTDTRKERLIVFTHSTNILLATTLSRLGLKNIYVLPFELQKFKNYLLEILEYVNSKKRLIYKDALKTDYSAFERFGGKSQETIHLIELAKKVTFNNSVNSLILGETGTGKGLLAKCIHEASVRRNKPYIDINCAAIPHHLLESELFGYEKGAFTDARSTKIGLMELAESGTIFLDEIGDMSLDVQAKLLRAIDNKMIRRLGGTNDIFIKARIISATNRSLELLVSKKKFRSDLYHRLNVISLNIAPLRERVDDILILAEAFAIEISKIFSEKRIEFSDEVKEFMLTYSWPGNVRELRNAIERGILLSDDAKFKLDQMFLNFSGSLIEKTSNSDSINSGYADRTQSLEIVTKLYVKEVLEAVNGNKSHAAKLLKISRPRLDRILKSNS